MLTNQNSTKALSWEDLSELVTNTSNNVQGPTNSYSLLRLFGKEEKDVRVTLYRDNHAWCPYCQKVWLWLEWKQIPYKVRKVTMRCYGHKERWYLKKVPSGMLPALELDERLITESDQILLALENAFGAHGTPLEHSRSLKLRNLERQLFRAWCIWLCNLSLTKKQQEIRKKKFQEIANLMEKELQLNNSPWLDPTSTKVTTSIPGSSDIIFIPYVERMNASLAYYKGFCLRDEHPAINNWLKALENLDVYRGTQGDFHTHAHDLPPQMGGCWTDPNPKQKELSLAIDMGKGLGELETCFTPTKSDENPQPENIALERVIKHHQKLIDVNPLGKKSFDQPLRAALTLMMLNQTCAPNEGSAAGLRYLRDRISVPRDMPLLAGRKLRHALELTAQMDGRNQGPPIPTRDRFDQSPEPFQKNDIKNNS